MQTQKLPNDAHAQNALVEALDLASWQAYLDELDRHRQFVHHEFDAVIGGIDEASSDLVAPSSMIIKWQDICAQCDAPEATFSALAEFAASANVKNLTAKSRERLDQFMPLLLAEAEQYEHAERVVERIIPLLRSVIRRSAYLVLLIENPHALTQLVTLVQTSQQIAEQLAAYPALLDELLDTASLYSLPEKTALKNELQRAMMRIDEVDLELQMDTLRYFKLSHALRVAACEVSGALPLMKVSDYLTLIAEVIVDYSLTLSWRMMVTKHGYPDGIERQHPDFLVVGYGKLGGIEMNHGSDLDLVFIHNASPNGNTNGPRELDNGTFYVRLGQKLIHIINTHTVTGRLYEVDMRLRPSGNSGLLATTLTAFKKYQTNDAWTWEHQALVRARPVAGDSELAQAFNNVREQVLAQRRDHQALAKDIVEMRLKMRAHLGSQTRDTAIFNLKQDPGGIVDIEFMVQYLVLAWSHAEPSLATYTDNIRILEALAHTDQLSTQEVEQLIAAYKALRTYLHRQTIEQKSNEIDSRELQSERESVIAIWRHLFG